jgi:hypothetical protein
MLSDMMWENVSMKPQLLKIRSEHAQKKIDSKYSDMAMVFFSGEDHVGFYSVTLCVCVCVRTRAHM